MTNDVEKRWHDPPAVRSAITYVAVVVAITAGVFAAYLLGDPGRVGLAAATPAVLFLGALGAFVKTYLDWRANRTWPIWQGAGWFLLTVSILSFGVPAAAVL
jgi:hypothetical protein